MSNPKDQAHKPPRPVTRFPAQFALMMLVLLGITAIFVAYDWRSLLGLLVVYGAVVFLVYRINWRR
jgi:4-hydroxybenzoate polyprenyltransferase